MTRLLGQEREVFDRGVVGSQGILDHLDWIDFMEPRAAFPVLGDLSD